MFWYDNPVFAAQVNSALSTVDPDARFEPLDILENPYGYVRNYQQPTNYVDEYYFSADTRGPGAADQVHGLGLQHGGHVHLQLRKEGETYYLDDNGNPQWLPEVLAEYADNDNAYYAVQSDFGILNNNSRPRGSTCAWKCSAPVPGTPTRWTRSMCTTSTRTIPTSMKRPRNRR
jgi:hypothetical protein